MTPAASGDGGLFPVSRWSAIEGARSADPVERRRAQDRLAGLYWKPVYKYMRLRWRRDAEDAADLTQELFASLIERDAFASYDPSRSRLRTFIRSCIDALVANADRDARRLKRGGGAPTISLDSESAERELARTGPPSPDRIDEVFEQEWTRSIFSAAVDRLREACSAKGRHAAFTLFERRDLADHDGAAPTYAELGRELGLSETDVTNKLAAVRREFREIVLDVLRETTATDEEYRREARSLLGHAPRT